MIIDILIFKNIIAFQNVDRYTPLNPPVRVIFIHLHTKSPKTPIIRQNIYCLYVGAVYMVQLQANPGVPKLAQFWRDPAFVNISY
jgi:hypothetical protein